MIRRPRIETRINHERWLVSYSDFVTLLFAFFVVMYSVSSVNEKKYRQLAVTLESAFSGNSDAVDNLNGVDVEHIGEPLQRDLLGSQLAEVDELADDIKKALSGVVDDDKISLSGNEEWVEIELSANLLFSLGSSRMNNEAKKLLSSVAEILAPFDNAVAIAGHTDDLPINNAEFDNNWALSSARAVSVVNFLAYQGVKPHRLSAVGYGEHRPILENTNNESRMRNRRVVIKIAKNAVPPPKIQISQYQSEMLEEGGLSFGELNGDNSDRDALENTNSLSEGSSFPIDLSEPPVNAVRLEGGGLLFSSDPDLPRNNPPVKKTNKKSE